MSVYLLSKPTPYEKKLRKNLISSERKYYSWKKFPSDELFVNVEVYSEKVIVIGRNHPPAENMFETLLLCDTLKRNGADKILLVLPYFGYARQDRIIEPGDPVSGQMIIDQFKACGVKKILSLDFHSYRLAQSNSKFIQNISSANLFASFILNTDSEINIVGPDKGARVRAEDLARAIGRRTNPVWIKKKRKDGQVKSDILYGKLKGSSAVLVDDILDTGKTISAAVKLLKRRGIKNIHLAITHPIFSGKATQLVKALRFQKIFISDTLELDPKSKKTLKPKVVSSINLLTKHIQQGYTNL